MANCVAKALEGECKAKHQHDLLAHRTSSLLSQMQPNASIGFRFLLEILMSPATATEAHDRSEASKQQERVVHRQPPVLKGYIRKSQNESYEGVCLTLNLTVRGSTLEETEKRLFELIVAYLHDAHESDQWSALVPRHAPTAYYLEYYRLLMLSHFRSLADFKLFVQSAPQCTAYA